MASDNYKPNHHFKVIRPHSKSKIPLKAYSIKLTTLEAQAVRNLLRI
jgi:hypothetical protein